MKKLFGILALALLFSFIGTQEIIAQSNWEIKVTWDDDCDDCVQVTGHEYYVCLKIWNTCTETEEYYSCDVEPSGIFEHTFYIGEICLSDDELCFDVSARIIKRCVVSQDIICQNTETYPKSCDDITTGFEIGCDIP